MTREQYAEACSCLLEGLQVKFYTLDQLPPAGLANECPEYGDEPLYAVIEGIAYAEKKLIEAADALLQQESGWIACSDRMPEDYGIYGVRIAGGIYPTTAHFTHLPHNMREGFHEIQEPQYQYSINQVTHWQHLPEFPQ